MISVVAYREIAKTIVTNQVAEPSPLTGTPPRLRSPLRNEATQDEVCPAPKQAHPPSSLAAGPEKDGRTSLRQGAGYLCGFTDLIVGSGTMRTHHIIRSDRYRAPQEC
jgi:hypothetical protein